ncbi:MAG: T9SS type A sorting domain-containing protein [Candidatus Eisenbacteria bacterium]|uniref:T9SS type A sorting domain-containing protein n=1 Tax=Eiseniibacteriota bacterium TaxID=2212470 RepID=A0A849SSG5_UNCEI|nr:T9SS type A sorting domain-containing protein [Candidatus Eisenbacteria bacterium]
MQFRRNMKSSVLLLLVVGVAASTFGTASAEVIKVNPMAVQEALKAKARNSARRHGNTVLAPSDPDTVWIGHVTGATGLPGTATGDGPFHVGRGGNLETAPTAQAGAGNNGYWGWDDLNAGEADAHQGWNIVAMPHQSVSTAVRNDWWRCFAGLDFGNGGNTAGNGTKPTYGVTGYWHRDDLGAPSSLVAGAAADADRDPIGAPIGGSFSAWCGLRSSGDLSFQDPITKGYYNSDIVSYYGDNHALQTTSTAAGFTDMNFPGYGDQWDQLMYRDVVYAADGGTLQLSFDFRHNLLAGKLTDPLTRIGWYMMDPLLDVAGSGPASGHVPDGNFISSSAFNGQPANLDFSPEDSFMVYVGVPVNDAAVTYTDGSVNAVGDPLRRWFSEVIRVDGWVPGTNVWPATLIQLKSSSGVGSGNFNVTLNNAALQPLLNATAGVGGTVRIVWRVKTNRASSDEDFGNTGNGSGGGAAVIDNVNVNGSLIAGGDFEAAGSVDNTAAATAAFRSTGKAVGQWWELRDIGTLSYADPCGNVGTANRNCNMYGNVFRALSGVYATNTMDRLKLLVSPTINLVSTGVGVYNGQGIDTEIAEAEGDIAVFYDVYTNLLQFGTTGNGLRNGWQSYPGTQVNGINSWGIYQKTISFSAYDGFLGCYAGVEFPGLMPAGASAFTDALILTTNASGIPDSIRVGIEQLSICFRRPATTPATCNAAGLPDLQGFYADNVSVAFIDAAAPPGLSNNVWDVWQDAFPTNSALSVGTDAFRRGTAQVRTGYNNAQGTGDLTRNNIPGDSMLVIVNGTPVRADIVFRIKPGAGNYQTIGDPTSGIRRSPAVATTATSGDGSFWGSYMADRGVFGSGYVVGVSTAVPSPMVDRFAGGGLDWNPNQWLSARIDSTERNLFACEGSAGNIERLNIGQFSSLYHEADITGVGAPRRSLGIVKNRCVLIDTSNGSAQDQTNIDCGSGTTPAHPSGRTWAQMWTASNGFAYNNVANLPGGYVDNSCPTGACANGTTAEYTKVIPDDQLTPGAHVEWFFRRAFEGNFTDSEIMPDTTLIFPNVGSSGGIFDGDRWYSMNVLPDEWKNPAFNDFGLVSVSSACMLFVDQGDRRGDHLLFDNMAQVIGLTKTNKFGAGTGYFIGSTADFPADLAELATVGGTQVSAHLGQEGSLYDVFNVRAGESNVPAGRLGSRDASACIGLATGKCSTAGPTKTWLRSLYQHLFVSAADLKNQVWGPLPDQTDGDYPMFADFVNNPVGTPAPRTFIITGLDIVAGNSDVSTGDPSFFPTYFDAGFVNDSYRDFAASSDDTPDLIPQAPIGTSGTIYGVFSSCFTLNDVLSRLATLTGSSVAAFYEDTNPADAVTYPAGVYAPENIAGNRFARTLVLGFTHGAFGGLGSRYTLTRGGYHEFWLGALTGMAGTVCGQTLAAPVGVGDGGGSGRAFVNFLNLRSPNPLKSGTAVIEFGLAKTEKVQVNVYDVTGRLVKTLADREFKSGEAHRLTWNGSDESGRSVARGVYFYQLRSPSFTSQKKLTVLRD